jgi:hypothetical protein
MLPVSPLETQRRREHVLNLPNPSQPHYSRRLGLFRTLRISAAACALSLVVSALTADFFIFSVARLVVLVLGVIACLCQRQIPQATHWREVGSRQFGALRPSSLRA